MRRVAGLLVLITGSFAADEGVRWRGSFEGTVEAAQESGRPVLALFWAEW
ncbi:MAG: hypothetical protein ACE5JG_05590 [Planctomycetota bacterium]